MTPPGEVSWSRLLLVRALKVSSFRNLRADRIEPGPRFNVFAGNNGQGKTNLLEALYAVCTLRSFRSSRMRDLIAIGQDSAYVAAHVERDELERVYELTLRQRSRSARLDGKSVRPIARYFGGFNVVLFAPEDLLVARGAPAERRRFLDRAVFTRKPSFLAQAQDYEKALKSRNLTLKDEQQSSSSRDRLLDVYDLQCAELGAEILRARLAYLEGMSTAFSTAFEAITRTGLEARLRYETCVPLDLSDGGCQDSLLEAITRSRRADLARGSSNVGPHRDLLHFELSGQAAANFASQGQLRAMILAWKTAEMELLAIGQKEDPVLLLDDVSSELDPERNEYLFEFLSRRRNQCFITTTHPNFVLLREDRTDFRVENGVVSQAS